MAEYYNIDGRIVRIHPWALLNEVDERGFWQRQPNHFTTGFGPGKNPVEADRYILFWAKGCAWSNRASIVRELLGLQDAIKAEIMVRSAPMEDGRSLGWEFANSPNHENPETGARFLAEIYSATDPEYEGRCTAPTLIDYKTGKVANNDYHRLTNYFEVDFKPFHKKNAPDLYPEELRDEIDQLNEWLFHNVNNATYKVNFAQSLEAYKENYEVLFTALDVLDERLEDKRFLFGDYVTDSDVCLFVTLARLDAQYFRNFGPVKKRLVDYKNLWPYARELYQIPAFFHNSYVITEPYEDKYTHNKFYDFVLPRLNLDQIWRQQTNRASLSSDPTNKFRYEK